MRDIPKGSLADEIFQSVNPNVEKSLNILDNLKNIAKNFSDFESCHSSFGSGDSDNDSTDHESLATQGFETVSHRKRRNKRKGSKTPEREHFLKKQK